MGDHLHSELDPIRHKLTCDLLLNSTITTVMNNNSTFSTAATTTRYFLALSVIATLFSIGTVDARLRFGPDASNPLGCSASPSLRILKYLDRICDDCYMIYRDTDIYHMCRSDCYNNRFFLGCMDVMMVSKRTRSKAASFVNMINDDIYTSRRRR